MRTAVRRAVLGLAVGSAVVLVRPGTQANKVLRRQLEGTARRLRHTEGRLRGVSYRLRGHRPDPDVIDNVLADRIRSSLGGIEKHLDLPHIHVMVEDHVALLHGEITTEADALEIERAVASVSGVVDVESYLHVGLGIGDTRPSQGRAVHPPSEALTRLLASVTRAGVDPELSRPVLRGVLATFAERIPENEREQVAAHLPADVRPLFTPARRTRRVPPARTVQELVSRIAGVTAELRPDRAREVAAAVIDVFRELVPEEAHDVAAVLPRELRAFWEGQPA